MKKSGKNAEVSSTEENGMLPDYRNYKFSKKETAEVVVLGFLGIILIAWFFYRDLRAAIFLSPSLVLLFKAERKRRAEVRRRVLAGQFRDGLNSLAAAIRAGYAAENAFFQAEQELTRIYGRDSMLVGEFELIRHQLRMNRPVEAALMNLAERSGLEDIREAAGVFAIVKRNGGSLPRILMRAAGIMDSKGQVKEEIETMIAAKRLEHRLMSLMPLSILAYVSITSPEFLNPLYQGIAGRVIMTILLAVYCAAVWIGEKIMKLSV